MSIELITLSVNLDIKMIKSVKKNKNSAANTTERKLGLVCDVVVSF